MSISAVSHFHAPIETARGQRAQTAGGQNGGPTMARALPQPPVLAALPPGQGTRIDQLA